jgi:hypothetical protein
MAIPVAPNNGTPIALGPWGSRHQIVKSPSANTFAPPHFNPVPVGSALNGGLTGTSYSETITAQGGTSPYTFALTSGALPTGTTMSSSGVISGTPSVASTFSFTVTVTDSLGFTGSQGFTIIVSTPTPRGTISYTF